MPTFDTPTEIRADLALGGDSRARVVADERTDTVVDVRPADPDRDADVRAARETVIEFADGRLTVKTSGRRGRARAGGGGSVEVTVELPAGSSLRATAGRGIRGTGRLGEARLFAASGDIDVESAATLEAATADGDITVGRVEGAATVQTARGAIRVGHVADGAAIRTAHGAINVGSAGGDVRLTTAHGAINVEKALAGLIVRAASGDLRIGAAVSGRLDLVAGGGSVDVGIPEGTAARLDAHSRHGQVRTELSAAPGPAAADETVELRVRTHRGDILVRRS